MKVVLDTNVILAAFATRGLCEAVFAVCLDRHEIILSDVIIAEVAKHLERKFKLPKARVHEIVTFLRGNVEIVAPVDVPTGVCRDADDLPILGTAAAAQAECLITGDQDLLTLGKYEQTAILSPREFYDKD